MHYEKPSQVQICLAPVKIYAQYHNVFMLCDDTPTISPSGNFKALPWNVWLFHLVLLVKLAVKNKMYNTTKLETQD